MNERIAELIKQAGGIQYDEDGDELTAILVGKDLQKFAESIVKECARVFESEVDTWKQMDPYQGSIKRQGTKAIKQHFGVTE
jgi:hypothetical protein